MFGYSSRKQRILRDHVVTYIMPFHRVNACRYVNGGRRDKLARKCHRIQSIVVF